MAIDNAEKRRSAARVGMLGLLAGPGVTPNADADQEWRQQVAYSYSGVPVGGGLIPWWLLPEPLPTIIRAEPRILIPLFPGELTFSLTLTARGGRTIAPPVVRVGRGVCTISWRATATSPQLIRYSRAISSFFRVVLGERSIVAKSPAQHSLFSWRMAALGREYWPFEAQELRLLGLGDFMSDEDAVIFPALPAAQREI